MPVYVYLVTGACPSPVGTSSHPMQVELDRAHESITVLCDELEQVQCALAAKDAKLAETSTGVSIERFEAMRAERDHWRETAETTHRTLAILKRRLVELAGRE